MANVYEIITDQILEKLKKGVVPWHKPWSVSHGGRPKNLVSGKAYRGINPMLLAFSGYDSPYWLTYKQAAKLGGNVKKGSKSTMVIFWKPLEKENADTGKTEKHFMLRYYRVFNSDQCEGVEVPETKKPEAKKFKPIKECEKTVARMPKAPAINHGGDRACYMPSSDQINMPKKTAFDQPAAYYSTLFHELSHSTGHGKRLDRKGVTDLCGFGATNYSKEELTAEMGAAFLCAENGIENATIDNSAAYIDNWSEKLKDQPRMVIEAAGKAQKAADYILNREAV
jgi:antirestriction protein ArdC